MTASFDINRRPIRYQCDACPRVQDAPPGDLPAGWIPQRVLTDNTYVIRHRCPTCQAVPDPLIFLRERWATLRHEAEAS